MYPTTTDIEKNNNFIPNFDNNKFKEYNPNHHLHHPELIVDTSFNHKINTNITNPDGIFINSVGQLTPDQKSSKLFTIFGNDTDNEKLSGLPHSTTGSLSSIITTSIASSEPDPGLDRTVAGIGGGDGDGGNDPDEKVALNRPGIKQEPWWHITLQVSIPFFIAGIGTIGAGIVLKTVEDWTVFKHVSQLFILVPSLLGLKGNLDMCLASRLSTQANLGNMTSKKEIFTMVVGNIALVQVQAIVASFIVALFAISVGALLKHNFEILHVVLIITSATFTATSSCFVLDFLLVAVILISKKYKLNPDNLATPLAASIGDVVSISLFSFIASLLYERFISTKTNVWVLFVIIAFYLIMLPIWAFFVFHNKYTRPVLTSGWVPVISALFISGMGGLVLDYAVDVFNGFVLFQPIINGVGGNLVSVQASKISTMLHQSSLLGIIPPHTKVFELPWKALFNGVPYAKTARILICLSIPGQIIFVYAADFIQNEKITLHPFFVLSYLTVSLVQIMLLLYIAHVIIHAMWKWKVDPDNSAIPYLTAMGDLLGSSLLAVAFLFLQSIGKEYAKNKGEIQVKLSPN